MNEKSTKNKPMFFHYKFVVLITATMLFFNNCRPEKLSPAGSSDSTGTAVKTGTLSDNAIGANGNATFSNMLGVNSYEWDFLQDPANPNLKSHIYEANMALINSFSQVRHYMDWGKLENTKGNYTFSPTYSGSWDYDLIYTRCKQDGIAVVPDLKTCPAWLLSTYPAGMQDAENAPAPYGQDLDAPASYADQARVAFQFAARYGYNQNIDTALVKVDTRPRWTGDKPNVVKIGMNLIKYLECDNERDKWWKGPATKQTPEQYAANMSAFYDGDKGKLGKNAGVKNADPNMLVVMGGLATADINFVKRMVAWCKTNRGTKPDGSIDLCFDVINFHYYNNNGNILTHANPTTGIAPELSMAGELADSFVSYAKSLRQVPEVWVTETGYDINQQSYQKAIAIGTKSILVTQADWNLRTSLLYQRRGIKRVFFYQLLDAKPNGTIQYSTSGMAENGKRRPTADYTLQVKKLMGKYTYQETLNTDPTVDKYQYGSALMYVLTIPDQKGRTAKYALNIGTAHAAIYTPTPGADAMVRKTATTTGGKLMVSVSETPVFIEPVQ